MEIGEHSIVIKASEGCSFGMSVAKMQKEGA